MSTTAPDAGEFILGSLGTRLAETVHRIAAADSIAELAALAPGMRTIGVGLLDLDAGADLATRTVARLNDALTERIIAVAARAHRLPQAPWCWLSLGSEGRCEQTFVTDQDNGLLFSAVTAGEAAELRRLFLPFARSVNAALASCGFPLCPGEVMAGNPEWCLSFDEWDEKFGDWIRIPEPQALLNATIFFDFRPLYGDVDMATRLRARLLGMTADNAGFLHLMARNALAAAPPLGLFGDVVAADKAGSIDLKKFGSRIFVDAARLFALAAGVSPVNTGERLRAVAASGAIAANDATAALQAFEYIQRLRLDRQSRAYATAATPGNDVRLDALNEFERRMLGAALKQARRLQQQLTMSFGGEA